MDRWSIDEDEFRTRNVRCFGAFLINEIKEKKIPLPIKIDPFSRSIFISLSLSPPIFNLKLVDVTLLRIFTEEKKREISLPRQKRVSKKENILATIRANSTFTPLKKF